LLSFSLIGSKLTANTAEKLKNSLINTHWYVYFRGGIDRGFAIAIHLGLSILVIYAVKNRIFGDRHITYEFHMKGIDNKLIIYY
jgi:uncharacterized membrane protein YhfC